MNIKRDGCCRREEFAWDDSEERRYRAWVTEEARGREQAEWAEYSQEEETRRRARREVEDRSEDVEAVQRPDWAPVFAFVFNFSVGHVAFKH